jgi:glutathione S-transferase
MLRDGDAVLIESGAIFEYVLDRYGAGKLRPATTDAEDRDFNGAFSFRR